MKRIEEINGLLFLAPLFILMSIFVFYGIYFVVRVSFHVWNGIDPATMRYVGLENYQYLLEDPVFLTGIRNVLIFIALTVLIQMSLGLLVAVLLRPKLIGHTFYKGLFYIPAALSTAVIARIFEWVYEPNFGLLNTSLRTLGLGGWTQGWLSDPSIALYAIIGANIFQWMGAQMVFYIAGLTTISEEYFDASQIDGAGFWKTLFYIVLPLLKPTHATVMILGIIGGVKTFDIVWLLTQGGPGTSTQFLATFLYQRTVNHFQAGYGASIGVVIITLSLCLALLQNRFYERSKAVR